MDCGAIPANLFNVRLIGLEVRVKELDSDMLFFGSVPPE